MHVVAENYEQTCGTATVTITMKSTKVQTLGGNIGTFGLETPICMHHVLGIYRTSFQHILHCFIDACVHVVNDYIVSNNNNNTHIAAIAPLPLTTHPR